MELHVKHGGSENMSWGCRNKRKRHEFCIKFSFSELGAWIRSQGSSIILRKISKKAGEFINDLEIMRRKY